MKVMTTSSLLRKIISLPTQLVLVFTLYDRYFRFYCHYLLTSVLHFSLALLISLYFEFNAPLPFVSDVLLGSVFGLPYLDG